MTIFFDGLWSYSIKLADVLSRITGTRVALAVPAGKGSISGIENRLLLETALPDSEHVRDAIVCALAGLEFLAGRCVGPAEHERALALKEGWIWSPALRTP